MQEVAFNSSESPAAPQFPLQGSRIAARKEAEVPNSVREDFEILKMCLQVQDTVPEKLDAVIVCGSDLLHVADYAAAMYHSYAAREHRIPLVVTGGHGKLTPPHWSTEAAAFGARMAGLGVPPSRLILETEADTITANLRNGKKELKNNQIGIDSLVVITDDAQLKRAVLTARKEFADIRVAGSAPGYFDFDYAPEGWSVEDWRQRLLWTEVNELGRLVKYQVAGTPDFVFFNVSEDELGAGIRIGDYLVRDRSIPERSREHLRSWLSVLRAQL